MASPSTGLALFSGLADGVGNTARFVEPNKIIFSAEGSQANDGMF